MKKYSSKNLNLRAKFQNQHEERVVTADATSACLPQANKPTAPGDEAVIGGAWRRRRLRIWKRIYDI